MREAVDSNPKPGSKFTCGAAVRILPLLTI
jgi:hypothetical protein